MEKTLAFPDLLRLIDERSTAFRAAVASAPSLDVPVPTCPGWALSDLVQHLGAGRRKWARIVAAGPADAPPALPAPSGPVELAASTRELVDALRAAGPDRGCWTPWPASQSPQTCGAVARHQLQEIAVHTYDAQVSVGAAEPLPDEVALDGVEEFQFTVCATTFAWPHRPAVVDYHATEGRSWRLWLSADGARVARVSDPEGPADAAATGTASDLVLAFYNRIPLDSLKVDGDRRIFDQLIAWEPGA